MRAVLVSVDVFPLTSPAMARCPECRSPLDLHQPDAELPERMLGTCVECKAWYLLDEQAGLMARMPAGDELRDG